METSIDSRNLTQLTKDKQYPCKSYLHDPVDRCEPLKEIGNLKSLQSNGNVVGTAFHWVKRFYLDWGV